MARIRPVTNLAIARLKISGTARTNGGTQLDQGSGAVSLPRFEVAGQGQVRVFVGNVIALGAVALKKLRVTNGSALAIRRSRSTSATVPTKKLVVAGTGAKVVAFAAVVVLYGPTNSPAGYGPTEDPNGVFFGDTSLVSGDVWWPSNPTAGVVVTGFAGGTFHSFSATLNPGTPYSFTVNLRRAIGGVRSTFVKNSTLT